MHVAKNFMSKNNSVQMYLEDLLLFILNICYVYVDD